MNNNQIVNSLNIIIATYQSICAFFYQKIIQTDFTNNKLSVYPINYTLLLPSSQFIINLNNVKYVIGHNLIGADIPNINRNIINDNNYDLFGGKIILCTMNLGKTICNLKTKNNRIKPPKLEELYRILFKKQLVNAHNASYDVKNTMDCFIKLKSLYLLDEIMIENRGIPYVNKNKKYTVQKSVSFCDCIIQVNRNLDKIISSRKIKKILEKNGITTANLKSGSKYYGGELTRLHSLLIQKSKLIGELLLFDVDNDSI